MSTCLPKISPQVSQIICLYKKVEYPNRVKKLLVNRLDTNSTKTREINMFNKILVAMDRSPASRNVFEFAMSLAKATGASLMLLHVLSSEEKDFPIPTIYSGLEYESF